jgi:hypothetical protein
VDVVFYVYDETRNAVPDAKVQIMERCCRSAPGEECVVVVDARGEARIRIPPVGECHATVEAEGYEASEQAFLATKGECNRGTRVEVTMLRAD